MEFNRCTRCGNFYVSEGNVCPKCSTKDGAEFSIFKTYIEENGMDDTLETISGQTGISEKNINRFLQYDEFVGYQEKMQQNEAKNKIEGITYFI